MPFFNGWRSGGTGIPPPFRTRIFYFSQNTTRQGVDYWACWLRALSSTFRTRHHDEVLCFVERSGRHPAPGGRLRDWARTETATAVREIYAAVGTAYGQAVTG